MRLEPLEVACGTVLEPLSTLRAIPRAPRDRPRRPGSSRAALEDVIGAEMRSGRASVSFSGGRDSSLVLAVATMIARRDGLPEPVPITMRHPSPESREDEWQESVIRHLGLREWLRVDIGAELDILGDAATDLYLREGLLAPANSYMHLGVVNAAPEGTLLTGGGGDQVLGTPGWRLAQVLSRRDRPHVRDLLHLGHAVAPMSSRVAVQVRRDQLSATWLRPHAAAEVRRRRAISEVGVRLRWDGLLWAYLRSRSVRMDTYGLNRVGARREVRVVSPFQDEGFGLAFAAEWGMAGPPSRDESMRLLGHDLLPAATITRRSKASFGGLAFGPGFRRFVRRWDPDTLSPQIRGLIDIDRLREAWNQDTPVFQSVLLVQQAWLDQRAAD